MHIVNYRPYQHEDFATLPAYDRAKDQTTSLSEEVLKEVAWIFQRWAVHDVVGLTLLHKHFDVQEDELLLRTYSSESNTMEGGARVVSAVDNPLEYMWRFRATAGVTTFAPIEFLTADCDLERYRLRARLIRSSVFFLNELCGSLQRRGLDEYFGLSLLPAELFAVTTEETLVENSNDADRIFRLTKVRTSSFDRSNTTQTLWSFPGTSSIRIGNICVTHCGSHCKGHTHCNSHCRSHCNGHVKCGVHTA